MYNRPNRSYLSSSKKVSVLRRSVSSTEQRDTSIQLNRPQNTKASIPYYFWLSSGFFNNFENHFNSSLIFCQLFRLLNVKVSQLNLH